MKTIMISFFLIFAVVISNGQTEQNKSKKATQKAEKKQEVKNLLENKNFVFKTWQANTSGGKTIQLSTQYQVKITGDTIHSYLPFFGVAYTAEYGSTTSPYNFTGKIREYQIEKNKKGYLIEFETKNKMDLIDYRLRVSDDGYATLDVTSVDRRLISFYGRIEKIDDEI